jgi:hypothetical protein
MRHANDVRAFHRDENERWIELLAPAKGLPPLAEDRRAAPTLPESCCEHAMGSLNPLLVRPWTKRGRHNAIRPPWRFGHAGQIAPHPQHLALAHQVWSLGTARQVEPAETSDKSLKIAVEEAMGICRRLLVYW